MCSIHNYKQTEENQTNMGNTNTATDDGEATLMGPHEERQIKADLAYDKILKIKKRARDGLLSKRGVRGLDVNFKITQKKKTNILSIVVYVDKKMPADEMERNEMIPHEVDGIPTDVIECDPKGHWPLNEVDLSNSITDKDAENGTITGGCDISNVKSRISRGSVGLVFTLNEKPAIISCHHVLASRWDAKTEEHLVQPCAYEGGRPPMNLAGRTINGWYGEMYNVDLGVAEVLRAREYTTHHIPRIMSDLTGVTTAMVGDRVIKYGCGTGYTEGVVTSVDFDYRTGVPPDFPEFVATGCIKVEADKASRCFASGGDTGAMVALESNRRIIGMIIGGCDDPQLTVVTPIQIILQYINSL